MNDQVSHERVFLVQDLYVIFPMLFLSCKDAALPDSGLDSRLQTFCTAIEEEQSAERHAE